MVDLFPSPTIGEAKEREKVRQNLQGDLYRKRTAEKFGIPYESVTPELRKLGKILTYVERYGTKIDMSKPG